jgi:phenylpropionate dioxygenase-like ring-hydroxylating dioxygenase large terminal subunit
MLLPGATRSNANWRLGRSATRMWCSDGEVAALEDACWHRLLPLSLGHLKDDQVVCGYHGLVFNSAGRCTYMPAQKTINPSACVHAYPIVERHRLVWLWPGDPALADPAKVPDFHWNDGADWVGDGGTFYSLGCDYRLVVDNLMDLTHETTSMREALAMKRSPVRRSTSPIRITLRPSHAG